MEGIYGKKWILLKGGKQTHAFVYPINFITLQDFFFNCININELSSIKELTIKNKPEKQAKTVAKVVWEVLEIIFG